MSGWSVVALRYAARPVTRSGVFHRYEEYGEPDGPQEMTYYVWVLRRGERTILVDTGYSAKGGANRGRGHIVAPLDALARIGVRPDDVDLVVNTHLHYDHTGHLTHFNAPLLINATELAQWTSPLAERDHFAVHVEPEEIAAAAAYEGLVTMGPEHEVAPGVLALEVGGHSFGQVILVVDGEQAPVILASDAVHFYEELERDRACAVLTDLPAVYTAYDRIRTLADERGARVLAGHDPLVMERFPRLRGADAELGVRVA